MVRKHYVDKSFSFCKSINSSIGIMTRIMPRIMPRIMRKNKQRFTQGPYRPYDADRYDTDDGATDSYDIDDGMTDRQLTGITKRLDSVDEDISILNERLLNTAEYNTEEHRRIHASFPSLYKANAKTDAGVKELIQIQEGLTRTQERLEEK